MLYAFLQEGWINGTDRIPGEGAAFLLLSRPEAAPTRLASIRTAGAALPPDGILVDHSGFISPTSQAATSCPPTSCTFSHLWGHNPTGFLFSIASTIALLRNPETHLRRLICQEAQNSLPPWIVERPDA